MKILVGSTNPVKIEAVREAFSNFFEKVEVIGIGVDSKVSKQPVHEETYLGAKNRAKELLRVNKEKNLGAEFFVGVEGGVIKTESRWFAFGAMCIMDTQGRMGLGASPQFELPAVVAEELRKGEELGDVMDRIIGEHNTKLKQGAVGFFTRNVMDRKAFYSYGLLTALIPFLNPGLYFGQRQDKT